MPDPTTGHAGPGPCTGPKDESRRWRGQPRPAHEDSTVSLPGREVAGARRSGGRVLGIDGLQGLHEEAAEVARGGGGTGEDFGRAVAGDGQAVAGPCEE